jgi:hypothetical protein
MVDCERADQPLSRGFPRTRGFVQARVAFAVARARCSELLDAPRVMTLWNLPASVEDQFEAAWHTWLDEPERWQDALQTVSEPAPTGILDRLRRFHLFTPTTSALVANVQASADGRTIPVPGKYEPNDEILTALARGTSTPPAFFLTHAFVFALEAGTPEARALNRRLAERGRAHVLTF